MWNAELGDAGTAQGEGKFGIRNAECGIGDGGRQGGKKFGMRNWGAGDGRVRRCLSVAALCLGSRLLFAAWRQTGRLAIACVPIPPGRDRCSCVLVVPVRLYAFVGSLRVCAFICGDLDGVTGDAGTRGTGLAAPRLYAFAQPHWPCESFRGEYAGAARPRLRQRVKSGSRTAASLDSLHAAAGLCWCEHISLQAPTPQSAPPRLQNPGTRKDLPGSDLWPGRSGCIEMIPTRTIVQTRAAPKRRGVGLRARSGEEAGSACLPPGLFG